VGYLLDQIRANGEKKELVDEVVSLAKKYGIATPYTSYLIVPDAAVPVVSLRASGATPYYLFAAEAPAALNGGAANKPASKVLDFAKQAQGKPGELAQNRDKFENEKYSKLPADGKGDDKDQQEAKGKKEAYDRARDALSRRQAEEVQTGKLGVDLSVQTNNLRNQSRLDQTAQRRVYGRNCLEIGGVWIDDGFDAKMRAVTVKAMSPAYFRILELHPKVKEVFRLGNHLVWVTPSGTALVIDTNDGQKKLSDKEIAKLFVARK
jgi:Ca-activated chloride channel family protein